MKSFLLALFLLTQAGPQGAGVVTGVVRGANGMPASGVRVYAIGVRDSLEALRTGTAPLEGLTQTDASGRYRLEVAPGRYYIASGSVTSPTFYAGTANAADARVVTVASGGVVAAIDFSSFVPASRSPQGLVFLPTGTGVLSGVIRFPDGTPAAGTPVVIQTASVLSGGGPPAVMLQTAAPIPSAAGAAPIPLPATTIVFFTTTFVSGGSFSQVMTDANGRYTFSNVPQDTFYIAAGYAESPTLYPGVTDLAAAKSIATTPTTNVNNLDFTVPPPPTGSVTVRGRVTATGDAPTGAVRVDIVNAAPPAASSLRFGLPTINPNRFVDSGGDGRFEFHGIRPGSYTVKASYSALYSESKNIVVADQPLESVDFILRAATLSGRILDESGSPIPEVQLFGDVVVSTVSNPNIIASTIFHIAADGSFGRILEAEEYRFFLRTLPEGYSLKSITAGGVDLMKETLKFTGTEAVKVDVRVARRTTPADPAAVSVKGRTIDAVSGAPSVAERITLCCRGVGPIERLSARVQADGSFEFAAVPAGRFTVNLQTKSGTPNLFVVDPDIVVGTDGLSGLKVLSTPQFAELSARLVLESGPPPPDGFSATVVFIGANGRVQVPATMRRDGSYFASVPAGERYTVSVTGMPEGYSVKSSGNSGDVRPSNTPQTGAVLPLTPVTITVTLSRESR
jgi:hypothetical protein